MAKYREKRDISLFRVAALVLKESEETRSHFVLDKADLCFRRERGLLPVGRLLVGVDASVPLHCSILFAGLGSFDCSGARCCCHGGSCLLPQVKLPC